MLIPKLTQNCEQSIEQNLSTSVVRCFFNRTVQSVLHTTLKQCAWGSSLKHHNSCCVPSSLILSQWTRPVLSQKSYMHLIISGSLGSYIREGSFSSIFIREVGVKGVKACLDRLEERLLDDLQGLQLDFAFDLRQPYAQVLLELLGVNPIEDLFKARFIIFQVKIQGVCILTIRCDYHYIKFLLVN